VKAAVIVFPGSNCDRDLADAITKFGIDADKANPLDC
jgi:phosphoribosylformylglycinamidine (FGAM) synthase-like amidotransferase family enzyme